MKDSVSSSLDVSLVVTLQCNSRSESLACEGSHSQSCHRNPVRRDPDEGRLPPDHLHALITIGQDFRMDSAPVPGI